MLLICAQTVQYTSSIEEAGIMERPEGRATTSLRRRLTAKLKKVYQRSVRTQGDPNKMALGFALGIFVGMTPVLGLHILVAVFLAALFKWNKISAALGVWITNPLTAPFVFALNYVVGVRVLGLHVAFILPKEYSLSGFLSMLKMTPELLWILSVGGMIVSVPLCVLGYFASYAAITGYRRHVKAKLAAKKATLSWRRKERKRRLLKAKRLREAPPEGQMHSPQAASQQEDGEPPT